MAEHVMNDDDNDVWQQRYGGVAKHTLLMHTYDSTWDESDNDDERWWYRRLSASWMMMM